MSSLHPPSPSNLLVTAAWEKSLVPATGGEATLLVRLKAADAAAQNGHRRAPVDVAFVLDRSGSMAGDKLALVKEAVAVAVGQLRDEDRTALVIYDHEVETLQHLEAATPRVKTALRLALQGVDAGGSTNLSGGWLTGCDELSKGMAEATGSGPLRIRRTLLLTDGLANVGISNADELTKHAHELRRRGIATTTLGVGLDFDEDLLAGMAEAGGGNFQFIDTSGELRAFFARELGELLTVVAAGLSLSLTLPHGVRARLINAFPAERHGKRIDVALGDLPASDELNLIFAVAVEPGARDATHLATLSAVWSDPTTDSRRSFDLTLPPLRLADSSTVDASPADPDVAEQAALQLAAVAQREAMRLDREGRYAESRSRMAASAHALAAAPATAAVHSMQMSAEALAAYDASETLSEGVRKSATYHALRFSRGKADDTSK
ncbi:MAG: Ca-activated chloride channel [Thermomicrobiales bacterium]|jgi:Ca-activated chloride channel family protein|nr:Ca-activated chloride channel [Thermomicrobiales bacterium]